ncbi:MAG: hypothetical protein PF482_13235 [Desulfobacteraceae bacterium]|jgi:hypothetical protein|nr:hypothetical protein [Desulfobacteraceae bacterium]
MLRMMKLSIQFFLIILFVLTSGCGATKHITFPDPAPVTQKEILYDVNGNGISDFALQADAQGNISILAYDEDEDGRYERIYNINDYANEDVPHLIILLDSIPYQCVVDKYKSGHFSWFPPPQKVIAPFPSLTDVVYNRLLHVPPRAGTNNHFYDHRTNSMSSSYWNQMNGVKQPWERYLDYSTPFFTMGRGFMKPRQVYPDELEQIKQRLDQSPSRVTIVYDASSAGMVCKYGRQGAYECLDGVERLCLQLLWERQGAIKISIMADHGHNLMKSKFISLQDILNDAGFKVTDKIESKTDIVIDAEGLCTYAGIHTREPSRVADVLLKLPQTELVLYMAGDRVIVRDARGTAAIEKKGGKLRYIPIDSDVLSYQSVIEALTKSGKIDVEGFASDDDWFEATVDHEWPDAPSRIWNAFHGTVVCTPDLMVSILDGFYNGFTLFESFIDMASIHGGLNQINSATFLLSMTGRANRPLRSREVLKTIEPDYVPAVKCNTDSD